MKLLSQVSRIYREKRYIKYWIIIPSSIIKKIGWEKGVDLELEIDEQSLRIYKKDRNNGKKM